MSEATITIRVDDEVLFRLREGCRPLVYPDMISRVSYDTGMNVLHAGTVWAIGELEGVMALELDDSTIVAADDIDPDSVVVNPTAGMREAVEE
ncbi:hypothetical protein AB1285_04325 [Microbacterium sp. NRRL B-14842]|uniref:hypothetical protein n=1 Tax=Microbacterium sp. NRRL B-14842 TaxID=3162881 RepID=UPI003519C791